MRTQKSKKPKYIGGDEEFEPKLLKEEIPETKGQGEGRYWRWIG